MNRYHILGWTMLACALGAVVVFPDSPETPGAMAGAENARGKSHRLSDPPAVRVLAKRPPRLQKPAGVSGFGVAAREGSPAGVEATARWIDETARQRLQEMTARYRLTPGQQARIFPVLARNLAGFSPAMILRGTGAATGHAGARAPGVPVVTGTSLEDELFALLDPEQQARLAEESVDTALWWQAIASQLEADLHAAISSTMPVEPGVVFEVSPPDAPDQDLSDLLGN